MESGNVINLTVISPLLLSWLLPSEHAGCERAAEARRDVVGLARSGATGPPEHLCVSRSSGSPSPSVRTKFQSCACTVLSTDLRLAVPAIVTGLAERFSTAGYSLGTCLVTQGLTGHGLNLFFSSQDSTVNDRGSCLPFPPRHKQRRGVNCPLRTHRRTETTRPTLFL
jgi:hypothetical protein